MTPVADFFSFRRFYGSYTVTPFITGDVAHIQQRVGQNSAIDVAFKPWNPGWQ